jgi:hypothetical protein
MTRTYAAKRLLEHGGLSMGELVQITGWTYRKTETTIQALKSQGIVSTTLALGVRRSIYQLAT